MIGYTIDRFLHGRNGPKTPPWFRRHILDQKREMEAQAPAPGHPWIIWGLGAVWGVVVCAILLAGVLGDLSVMDGFHMLIPMTPLAILAWFNPMRDMDKEARGDWHDRAVRDAQARLTGHERLDYTAYTSSHP